MIHRVLVVLSCVSIYFMVVWVVKSGGDHNLELMKGIDNPLKGVQTASNTLEVRKQLEIVLSTTEKIELHTRKAQQEVGSFETSIRSLIKLLDEGSDVEDVRHLASSLSSPREAILHEDLLSWDFNWRASFMLLVLIGLLLTTKKKGEENHPEAIL